jgi:hypothetical protein
MGWNWIYPLSTSSSPGTVSKVGIWVGWFRVTSPRDVRKLAMLVSCLTCRYEELVYCKKRAWSCLGVPVWSQRATETKRNYSQEKELYYLFALISENIHYQKAIQITLATVPDDQRITQGFCHTEKLIVGPQKWFCCWSLKPACFIRVAWPAHSLQASWAWKAILSKIFF